MSENQRIVPPVGSVLLCCAVVSALSAASGDETAALPTIEAISEGSQRGEGLFDVLTDVDTGRLFLELDAPDGDGVSGRYLYAAGLTTGLGSNPVGLDRGQIGESGIVAFRRVGRRVLLVEENTRYVANTDDPAERRAVEQSFATAVLWGGDVVAEDPDGSFLIDATSLVVRDAHDVAARLKATGQGTWTLDPTRSAPALDGCLAFPDNVELEAIVTFTGSEPGSEVRSVSPRPDVVTMTVHQSFVRIPDSRYEPRRFDPRAGSFDVRVTDYAAPLDEAIDDRWLVRHRLIPRDPGRGPLVPVEPIVYHVDPGIPEPVRSAVLEGAGWWSRAFEAAGWKDAFRVELLPEDAHPLDVRYHVIEWVHRSTRGWSYGGGIVDPRTGERVKGHVSLGSLRLRQDRLLFEGLVGADRTGSGEPDDPVELALARIRQLAAHEVGHTLGFDHNFAASTYDDRASVMDYPAPLVRVDRDGAFDLTDAYAVGVGSWDVRAVRYAYGWWRDTAAERDGLAAILLENHERGLLFLNDADARPLWTAHPKAHLWDNGEDAVEELAKTLEVRARALERFDESNVAVGRPYAELEEALVPLYFHHRYQLEAAATWVGGVDYRHGVRGDGPVERRPVGAADQRRAINGVLAVLEPAVLDLPEDVIDRIPPRAPGWSAHRETLSGQASPMFDPLAAAAAAAAHALGALLPPERCVRLVEQHRRDPGQPGLEEVLSRLIDRTFGPDPIEPSRIEIARIVREQTLGGLIRLATAPNAPGAVRFRAEDALRQILGRLIEGGGTSRAVAREAHDRWLRGRIERFRDRRVTEPTAPPTAPPMPPGSPIGSGACSLASP